jgi:zinc and cadmium transporter
MDGLYAIISVIIVSIISVIVAIPLLMKKKISNKKLLSLLSISVGTLLAVVFLDILPETIEQQGYTTKLGLNILLGFLIMFLLEKLVHHKHQKGCKGKVCGHAHGYNLAPINLIGDGIHNFIDGLVIAGSYAINITVGITATISIIFHELPQEMADMGVLLYSGMSKKKAIFFNFLSSLTAIIGTIIGIFLIGRIEGFIHFMMPFAAGNFLYIAATNLMPELHRHCEAKDTIKHLIAILIGIGIIVLVTLYGHKHL